MAKSWIRKAGYPLVEAELENGSLILQQKRFVFNHGDSTLWPIPVVIKTDDKLLVELLDKQKKTISLEKIPEWFKVNHGQTGFYRVKYHADNLSKLRFQVSNKDLSVLDRWGIQNDIFELSINGELGLEQYLDFTRAYYDEGNYLVLSNIYQNMRNIYFVYSQEDFWNSIWTRFKDYHKDVFRKVLDRLGWDPKKDESQKDALLRGLAIRYLTFVEDDDVLQKGMEKFEGYLKRKIELHPDVKSPIFNIVAANGDEKIYRKFLELYSKTQSPEEKRVILIALGQFRNPDILKKVLDFSLTSKVKIQDIIIVFPSVASNPYSRGVLLPWFKKNWGKIKSLEKSGKLFIRILEAFISSCVNKEREKELKHFFKIHPVKYKMTLERAFEKVNRNISWLERNKSVLAQYFL